MKHSVDHGFFVLSKDIFLKLSTLVSLVTITEFYTDYVGVTTKTPGTVLDFNFNMTFSYTSRLRITVVSERINNETKGCFSPGESVGRTPS